MGLGTVRGARRWKRLRGVTSTQWAGEGQRSGKKDEQELGLLHSFVPWPATASSRPSVIKSPRRWRLPPARAAAWAPSCVTRWAPLQPTKHLLTTYHISTSTWSPLTCGPFTSPHTAYIPRPHYPWNTQGQRPGSSPVSSIIHAPSAPTQKGGGWRGLILRQARPS